MTDQQVYSKMAKKIRKSYLDANDQEFYDGMNRKIFHLKTMEKGVKRELSTFYGTDDSSRWHGTGHLVEELKAADRQVENMRKKVAWAEKEKQELKSNKLAVETSLEAKQLQAQSGALQKGLAQIVEKTKVAARVCHEDVMESEACARRAASMEADSKSRAEAMKRRADAAEDELRANEESLAESRRRLEGLEAAHDEARAQQVPTPTNVRRKIKVLTQQDAQQRKKLADLKGRLRRTKRATEKNHQVVAILRSRSQSRDRTIAKLKEKLLAKGVTPVTNPNPSSIQTSRGRTSSLHSSFPHHGDSADRSPRRSSRISSPRSAESDASPTESALARAEIYTDGSSSLASDRTLPSPRPSVGVGCSSDTSNGSSCTSSPRHVVLDASCAESALARAEIYSDTSSSLVSDRTLPSPRPSIGVGCSSDTSGSNSTPSPRARTPNALSVAYRTRLSSPREISFASREPDREGFLSGSRRRAPGRPSRFSSSEDAADSCGMESTTPGQDCGVEETKMKTDMMPSIAVSAQDGREGDSCRAEIGGLKTEVNSSGLEVDSLQASCESPQEISEHDHGNEGNRIMELEGTIASLRDELIHSKRSVDSLVLIVGKRVEHDKKVAGLADQRLAEVKKAREAAEEAARALQQRICQADDEKESLMANEARARHQITMEYEALLDKRLQAADQQCAELDQARVKGEAEKAKLKEKLEDKEHEYHELSMIVEEAVEEAEGWKQDVLLLRDKLKTAEQGAEETNDITRYHEREQTAQHLLETNENEIAAPRRRVAEAEEVAEAGETRSCSVRESMERRDRVAREEEVLAEVKCADVELAVRMAEVGAASASTQTLAALTVNNRDEETVLLSKRLEVAEQQPTALAEARMEWESEKMVLKHRVENNQRVLNELTTAVEEVVGVVEDSKRGVLLLKEKLAIAEQGVTATNDIVRHRESMEYIDHLAKMEREVLALQQRLGEKQVVSRDSAKRAEQAEVTAISWEREAMELRNRLTLQEESLAEVKRISIELTVRLAQMTEDITNFQVSAEKRASLCEAEIKMVVGRLEAAEQHRPAFDQAKADWASEDATPDGRVAGAKNEYGELAKTTHGVVEAAENCEQSVRKLREQLVAADRGSPARGKKIIDPHLRVAEGEDKLAKMSAGTEVAAETAEFWRVEAHFLRDRQNRMEQSMEAAQNMRSLSEVSMKEMQDEAARFKAEAEERIDSKNHEISLLTTMLTEMEDTNSQVGLATIDTHLVEKQHTKADTLHNLEQKLPVWRKDLSENEETHESEATTVVRRNRSAEREAASHHVRPTVVLDEVAQKAIERRTLVGRMARELRAHRPALREVAPNLNFGGGKFSTQTSTQTGRSRDEALARALYVPTTYKRWPFRPGNPCLQADSRENLRVGPEATRKTVETPATRINGERKREMSGPSLHEAVTTRGVKAYVLNRWATG